jgi:hypothetical protein
VSAESGYGVEAMFDDALEIAPNVHARVSTGQLNETIRRAIADHAVPSSKGKQIKIRYATQAEVTPPKIILFVSNPDLLHFSYVRFLENAIRKRFPFRGVPLTIELRKGSGEMTKEERLRAKREAGLAATQAADEEKRAAKAARKAQINGGAAVDDDASFEDDEVEEFVIDDSDEWDDAIEFDGEADDDEDEEENAEKEDGNS